MPVILLTTLCYKSFLKKNKKQKNKKTKKKIISKYRHAGLQIWSHFMNLKMETLVSFHHYLFKIISFHLCLQDGFSPSLTLFPQITTHAKTTHIHKMILLYSHSFLQLNLNFLKKKRSAFAIYTYSLLFL